MTKIHTAFVATLTLLVVMLSTAHSQGRLGVGMNVGGQRLYGDLTDVQFSIGTEGLVTYQFLPFAEVAFALGYSQLHYIFPPSRSSTTDMFNIDLKSNLDIISEGVVKPYVTVGVGALASKPLRKAPGTSTTWNASLFGGGGLKVQVHPQLDWYLGGDYRFVTGDKLDGIVASSKDGYLNLRTGVTYYLNNGGYGSPDVIASERLPFYELEDEPPYPEQQTTQQQRPQNYTPQDTKDMEEYVKLKSKVDELSGTVDAREKEISQLREHLKERRTQIESLEKVASTQPPKTMKGNSTTMSGFSDIYEQALTKFYNKKYSEALSLFKSLLQQYPNHALASSCQYWAGRSLFEMTRFDEAITEFLKVLSYGTSFKKDDALFYMGRAYLKLGSGEHAKELFSQLIQDYPSSEFVPEARDYLGKL